MKMHQVGPNFEETVMICDRMNDSPTMSPQRYLLDGHWEMPRGTASPPCGTLLATLGAMRHTHLASLGPQFSQSCPASRLEQRNPLLRCADPAQDLLFLPFSSCHGDLRCQRLVHSQPRGVSRHSTLWKRCRSQLKKWR